MNGKKSTITNRARHRPKARIEMSKFYIKILSWLHGRAVQAALAAGGAISVWLAAKGWFSGELSLLIGGAIGAVLAAFAKEAVLWIATKFIKDKQLLEGLKADGFAGPETRGVTNTPKLNTDGTPILPAIPTDTKP